MYPIGGGMKFIGDGMKPETSKKHNLQLKQTENPTTVIFMLKVNDFHIPFFTNLSTAAYVLQTTY